MKSPLAPSFGKPEKARLRMVRVQRRLGRPAGARRAGAAGGPERDTGACPDAVHLEKRPALRRSERCC